MHIQTEPVAGAVHVQVAVSPLLDQPVNIPKQQSEVDKALNQHA